jgi:hypothetical protein
MFVVYTVGHGEIKQTQSQTDQLITESVNDQIPSSDDHPLLDKL